MTKSSLTLPDEVVRALAEDPAFRLTTIDGKNWIDPYSGRIVPAPEGIDAVAGWHLLKTRGHERGQPKSMAELLIARWQHHLKGAQYHPAFNHFSHDRWLNPYSGSWVERVPLEDDGVGPRTLEAMARALATCAQAQQGQLLPATSLAALVAKDAAAPPIEPFTARFTPTVTSPAPAPLTARVTPSARWASPGTAPAAATGRHEAAASGPTGPSATTSPAATPSTARMPAAPPSDRLRPTARVAQTTPSDRLRATDQGRPGEHGAPPDPPTRGWRPPQQPVATLTPTDAPASLSTPTPSANRVQIPSGRHRQSPAQAQLKRDYMAMLSRPPRIEGYQVVMQYEPHSLVTRDIFDFIALDRSRLLIAIGECAGKDPGAEMLASTVLHAVRNAAQSNHDPMELAGAVEDRLNLTNGSTVTLCLAVLDLARRAVSYVSAGHHPSILLHPSGAAKMEQVASAGQAMGSVASAAFRQGLRPLELTMAPNDMLVLYTDGLWRRGSGSSPQLGRMGVAVSCASNVRKPPGELVAHLIADAKQTSDAPLEEDFTVIALRVKEPNEQTQTIARPQQPQSYVE